jgi:hypothetical protein
MHRKKFLWNGVNNSNQPTGRDRKISCINSVPSKILPISYVPKEHLGVFTNGLKKPAGTRQ